MWEILRASLLSARTPFCIQTKTGKEAVYASFSNGKYLTDEKFSEPRLRLSKQTRPCQKKKKKKKKRSDCELAWQNASGSGRACVSLLITYIIAPMPCSIPRRAALQSCVFKRKKKQDSRWALLERDRAAAGAGKSGVLCAGDRVTLHRRNPGARLTASQRQIPWGQGYRMF